MVEEVCSRLDTSVCQMGPKPKCVRISNRNDQDTESKALEMSSFVKRLDPQFMEGLYGLLD